MSRPRFSSSFVPSLLVAGAVFVSPVLPGSMSGLEKAHAQPAAPAADAQVAFEQAMQLFEAKEYKAALDAMNALDVAQLSKDQAAAVQAAKSTAQEAVAAANTPQALMAAAKSATAAGNLAQATSLYRQVAAHDDATAAQRAAAQAGAAAAERKLNAEVDAARKLVRAAEQDLADGNAAAAEQKLAAAKAAGLDLGWFENERLKRAEARVKQAKASEPVKLAQADDAPKPPAPPAAAGDDKPAAADDKPADDKPAEDPVDPVTRAKRVYAGQMVQLGDDEQAKGRYRLAIKYYTQALQIDPENAKAKAGIQAAQVKLDQLLAPKDPIEIEGQNRNLAMAAVEAEYNEKMNRSRDLLAQGKFTGSAEAVNQAKLILDRNQKVLPAARYQELRDAAVKLSSQVEEAERNAEALRLLDIERQQAADAEAQSRATARERQKEIHDLLIRARDLRKDQKYEEALNLLRQAEFLDPNNPAARLMIEMIEDTMFAVEARKMQRERDLKIAQHSIDINRAAMPHTELVTYPSDWPQLTRRRIEGLQKGTGDSEINKRVAQALDQAVPISFEENKLESVIDYLRNTTGQNFYANWSALTNNAGIERDAPVSLTLKGVPVSKVLNLILEQVSAAAGDLEPIGWTVDDGIVTISTKADLKKTVRVKIYDIRDLLIIPEDFDQAPEFDLNSALSNTNSGGSNRNGGGGGGGQNQQSPFSSSGSGGQDEDVSRDELITQVTELITENVGDFDEWVPNGGDISSIRELNGQLIIKTTPDNHRQILSLLGDLRETRALQINVEARFLTVTETFLEDIGLDIDVAIDDLGKFAPVTIIQDTATDEQRVNNDPVNRPGDIVGVSGGDTAADRGGATGKGGRNLAVSAGYLDDLQVSLLLTATQFHDRSMLLTAPRVTFFNGQRAYVLVAVQRAFVSDLSPTPDTFGFDPTLSVVSEGSVLDVRGTVSADRRYVTLTVRPGLSNVDLSNTFALGGISLFPNDPNDPDPTPTPIQADAQITVPAVSITELRTTVSVPDKGTLLMGGQRIFTNNEVESGIPILSKVPWLNRFFTNKAEDREESTLLILIKPTIIIQSENEELLWPGITDNPTQYPVTGPTTRRRDFGQSVDP